MARKRIYRRPIGWRGIWVLSGILLGIGISNLSWGADTRAPKYPVKSIDAVVPFAPGAGTDLMGRVVAEALSRKWKYPVNVVNKPGGNTIIGTNDAVHAAPDGYTVLVDSPGSSSMQVDMKDLPYQVEQRTFIVRAAASPMAFIVPQNCPWKTLKDVVDAAKKDPGSVTWTSLGGTSGVDLVMRQFFAASGINVSKLRMVTYPGASPACNSVAGGHVQLGAATAGTILPLVSGGNARCIAVTSAGRLKELPLVATTAEQGFASVNTQFWIGFSGPPGIAESIQKVWAEAVSEVLKNQDVMTKLARITSVPAFLGPEQFKGFISEESRMVKELIGAK